jgi:hypothetical protein
MQGASPGTLGARILWQDNAKSRIRIAALGESWLCPLQFVKDLTGTIPFHFCIRLKNGLIHFDSL